jgi:uncharacterized BrkB/YihY/UPF0761 family membrane protein
VSAAVVLMLWMYNSAQILVLGAAFNAALENAAGQGPHSGVVTSPSPAAPTIKPSRRGKSARLA